MNAKKPVRKVVVGPFQSRVALVLALKDELEVDYLQYVRRADGTIAFPEQARLF